MSKSATPLTEDPAVIEPYTLEVLALAEQLRTTLELIKRFDDAIATLAPTLPDYTVFASLPGAGAGVVSSFIPRRISHVISI